MIAARSLCRLYCRSTATGRRRSSIGWPETARRADLILYQTLAMLECLSVGRAMFQRSRSRIAAVLIALIGLSWVPLAHASLHDTPKPRPRSTVLSALDLPFIYDLDGDLRADRISLQSNGFDKSISIKFGNARNSVLGFTASSADQGTLVAEDIDHDGDLDLIWVGSSVQKAAVVFINDGKGDFAEAKDNAPYLAELNALLSSTDPSDQHSLQAGRQTYSLTSSSFPDIGLAVASRFTCPKIRLTSFAGFDGISNQQGFFAYLRKRGPPLILS